MAMEEDLTQGSEQWTDDMLWICMPETCKILLASVTPLNKKKMKNHFLNPQHS